MSRFFSSEALAGRFSAAIKQNQERADAAEEEQRAWEEEARRARLDLLDQLEEFAEQVDHFDVRRSESRLTLRYDGRQIRFEEQGNASRISVSGHGLSQKCHLEFHKAKMSWDVVFTDRHDRHRELPLLMRGLEELLARSLQVKPVSQDATPRERMGEGDRPPSREERTPSRDGQPYRFWSQH